MTAYPRDVVAIGDLLLIAISIPPREVERLLDSLAKLPHYINPALRYTEWQDHYRVSGLPGMAAGY